MSEPSTRDVIAGVLGEHGLGWIDNGNPDLARCYCGHRPRLGDSWHGHVADALIAAGVTMPETICGATTVRDGVDLTCDSPPGHDGDHCADFGIHWWPYEP